jgi:hypothetical protein
MILIDTVAGKPSNAPFPQRSSTKENGLFVRRHVPARQQSKTSMLKKLPFLTLFSAAATVLLFPFLSEAQSAKAVYYWVSHGSPADPVWTLFLQGAEQWAKDTGAEVRTSFHSFSD